MKTTPSRLFTKNRLPKPKFLRLLWIGSLLSSAAVLVNPGIAGAASFTFNTVADTSTAVPGSSGNFRIFDIPSISGSNIAFVGFDSSFRNGLYSNASGSLTAIADRNTAIPGGTGNFINFDSPSISGSNIAFRGFGSSFFERGIYSNASGSLTAIADTTTATPGGQW